MRNLGARHPYQTILKSRQHWERKWKLVGNIGTLERWEDDLLLPGLLLCHHDHYGAVLHHSAGKAGGGASWASSCISSWSGLSPHITTTQIRTVLTYHLSLGSTSYNNLKSWPLSLLFISLKWIWNFLFYVFFTHIYHYQSVTKTQEISTKMRNWQFHIKTCHWHPCLPPPPWVLKGVCVPPA